jgi:chemotaxis protein methyltransferase CheR
MTSEQFEFLRAFLKKQSGLVLGDDKRYLIDSRLSPVAKEFGHATISDMIFAMKRPGASKLCERITEAMTINESFFFRDMTPFDNFRKIMFPHMVKERSQQRRLRIWSAAASTGQEAYSLAIEMQEQKTKIAGWTVDIIGTDLSAEALDKARAGLYSQFEVQRGMPTALLMKYFTQQGSEWAISPAIKSMVKYQHFNLLNDYRSLGQFDIVFCRNVLIYFDRETKADILSRLAKQMAPDAFLVLGAAETIVGLSEDYKMVQGARGLYQRATDKLSTGTRPAAPAMNTLVGQKAGSPATTTPPACPAVGGARGGSPFSKRTVA